MLLASSSPAPYVAWNTLGQIVMISLVAGLSIVTLMALGVQALSQSRRDVSATVKVVYEGVVVLCAGATLGLIGWGFYLVVHKA